MILSINITFGDLILTNTIITGVYSETNRIFSYFLKKKTKGSCFSEVEKGLRVVGITHENEDFQERIPLQRKLLTYQRFQESSKFKTGKKLTDKRNGTRIERMQELPN